MSDRPIQVGDLVMVMSVCCPRWHKYIGRIGIVVEGTVSAYDRWCCGESVSGPEFHVPDAGSNPRSVMKGWFLPHELKRIDPPAEPERIETDEEIHA